MKRLLAILAVTVFVASCGDGKAVSVDDLIASGDLEAIRTQRTEIKIKEAQIQEQLKKLDAAIKKLDKADNSAIVSTLRLKDSLFQHFIEIQGNVETNMNVIIYPEYQGTLTRVLVEEGDRVTKGQLLGRIDDGGLGSQLAQLEAQAQLAKTTYDRQERLWEQKIGSEIQYLQAKTNYEASQNAVNQLKSQLGKTTIRAPFSGVIDEVITDQGTVVSPGQPVFRIVNLSKMFVKADVPERYLSSVVPGKDVSVNIPMIGATIESKVSQTGNYINPDNRSFSIEVNLPNTTENIKPNLTARVKINDYSNEEAIMIPLNVISENSNNEQYVYMAITDSASRNKAVARQQIIKTGKTQGDYIEVLEGLQSGQEIIVEGARTVKNGQEVNIINQ